MPEIYVCRAAASGNLVGLIFFGIGTAAALILLQSAQFESSLMQLEFMMQNNVICENYP